MSPFLPMLYLSPDDVVRIVQQGGLSRCIVGVAERIERDFLRWPQFDKSARVACHSRDGVIELMPIADEREFSFKYVNGHVCRPHSTLTLAAKAVSRYVSMYRALQWRPLLRLRPRACVG